MHFLYVASCILFCNSLNFDPILFCLGRALYESRKLQGTLDSGHSEDRTFTVYVVNTKYMYSFAVCSYNYAIQSACKHAMIMECTEFCNNLILLNQVCYSYVSVN